MPADPHGSHEEDSDDGDVLVLLDSCHFHEAFFTVLESLLDIIYGIFPPKILWGGFFSVEEIEGLLSLFIGRLRFDSFENVLRRLLVFVVFVRHDAFKIDCDI